MSDNDGHDVDDDSGAGYVAVEFVCTDRGAHAPVAFGFVSYSEWDDEEPITPIVFTRTRGVGKEVSPGAGQLSDRLDDRCPRCGRHPKYNAQTLRRIAAAVLEANLADARAYTDWGRRRKRLFTRRVDVSSLE